MQGDSNSSDGPGDDQASVDESTGQAAGTAGGESPSTPRGADPLAEAQADATRMKDAWMRSAADFDNFRKRTRKELEDARRSGREDLLRAVLPVFDNLERAIQSALRTKDVKAVADGLAMVQRQFTEALGREGIARIATVGLPFDPSVHEAIQQVETSDHAPGTVLAEVQPGYTQGDRLMRAAMVVVAKPKGGDGAPGAGETAS
jgi:molecular chaperone GrpE